MGMEEVQPILSSAMLALQLCLGLWQIVKLTPVGALVKGVMGWLLQHFGMSTAYARLRRLEGRVFKRVICMTTVEYKPTVGKQMGFSQMRSRIESSYLGVRFSLERRQEDKLFIDGKMSYYITDTIWQNLRDNMLNIPPNMVFLKGYKEIWEQVVTGSVMTLSEVLDRLILEEHTMILLHEDVWLLPVNLSVSEEKLLKFLNLVGLFLQTKKVYWFIPLLLSFMSAILEFSTALRVWLYSKVNLLFCCIMHLICDPLPRSLREHVYSLGKWVENLKPSNDMELRIVKGDICTIIVGGVKTHNDGATLIPEEPCFDLPGAPDTFSFTF